MEVVELHKHAAKCKYQVQSIFHWSTEDKDKTC